MYLSLEKQEPELPEALDRGMAEDWFSQFGLFSDAECAYLADLTLGKRFLAGIKAGCAFFNNSIHRMLHEDYLGGSKDRLIDAYEKMISVYEKLTVQTREDLNLCGRKVNLQEIIEDERGEFRRFGDALTNLVGQMVGSQNISSDDLRNMQLG